LEPKGQLARFGWLKQERVPHSPTRESGVAGAGERRCRLDKW